MSTADWRGKAVDAAEDLPIDESVPRHAAVAAHLHERNGDIELAAELYAAAAHDAPTLAERAHQTLQAARCNQQLRNGSGRRNPDR